jgi:hypothetical protein
MSSQHKPKPGDTVILTEAPLGLLNGLPVEDRRAITDIVGKRVRLSGYDDEGRAELEFTDRAGGIHFIYVSPDLIGLAE